MTETHGDSVQVRVAPPKMIRKKRLDHLPLGCCPGKVYEPESEMGVWSKSMTLGLHPRRDGAFPSTPTNEA